MRSIFVTATLDRELPEDSEGLNGISVRLTAEGGWVEVPALDLRLQIEVVEKTLSITITLQGDDPPIVPHDPAVHGGPYPSETP